MDSCTLTSFSAEERPAVVFWGCELNNTTRRCVLKEDEDLLEHIVFLRTVSLGEDADDVPHVVAVESKNMASILKPIPIVSLKHSALPMVSLDGFELIPPVSFILNSGTGPVYLNGQHLILGEDADYEPSEGDAPEDTDTGEGSYDDANEAKAEVQAEETSSER